jgi:uncharacterized protein (TIGR00255 family)
MTGQGEGRVAFSGGGVLLAEVRSVNNRHLKIGVRLHDGLGAMEAAVESFVRSKVRRGAIQVTVQWQGKPDIELSQIGTGAVQKYVSQLRELAGQLGISEEIRWSDLLDLPGVLTTSAQPNTQAPELEEAVMQAVGGALDEMGRMRANEGASMQRELRHQLKQLHETVDQIEQRAPEVIAEYRQRLRTRVTNALTEAMSDTPYPAAVQDAELIKEVAIFCDRADIREEIVRLRSHFSQLEQLLSSTESQGRKLDFLSQEMFRESNTIGSKASDAVISRHVVDLKTSLEQIRELIQNVE